MTERIASLPGDGIGPEVMEQALRVLAELPVDVDVVELPFGGAAIDLTGDPLPEETLAGCRTARAVLLGAVGGPAWDGGAVRPEAGLIRIRRELDVYANLRPAVRGDIDLLIVRELVGGLYYGRRGVLPDGTVFDTCEYHPSQVERIARRAFEIAQTRDIGSSRSTRRTSSTPRGSGGGLSPRSRSTTPTSSCGTRWSTAPVSSS